MEGALLLNRPEAARCSLLSLLSCFSSSDPVPGVCVSNDEGSPCSMGMLDPSAGIVPSMLARRGEGESSSLSPGAKRLEGPPKPSWRSALGGGLTKGEEEEWPLEEGTDGEGEAELAVLRCCNASAKEEVGFETAVGEVLVLFGVFSFGFPFCAAVNPTCLRVSSDGLLMVGERSEEGAEGAAAGRTGEPLGREGTTEDGGACPVAAESPWGAICSDLSATDAWLLSGCGLLVLGSAIPALCFKLGAVIVTAKLRRLGLLDSTS